MAKDGQVKNTPIKDKSFEGSGVEGTKEEAAKKPKDFDKTGATPVITHRDGLKRIWYRDGKEIGSEDAS